MEHFEIAYPVLPDIIADYARWQPDKEAVIFGEKRITWSELNQEINRVANALLDMGVKKGEKVCTLLDNSPEMLYLIFGITKAGGVVVPLSTWLQPDAVSMMIEDSDAKAIFVGPGRENLVSTELIGTKTISEESIFTVGYEREGWPSYRQFIAKASTEEPLVKVDPTGDFNVMYSSGTTGTPKGIVHTHYARSMFGLALSYALRVYSNSRSLVTTPLFNNGTWMITLPTLVVGGTVIIMPNFDILEFLRLSQLERPSHTFMVPTQYYLILNDPRFDDYDLSSYSVLISAGAPMMKVMKLKIIERFGCDLTELYGLTEGMATILAPQDVVRKSASVGKPIGGMDIRIIDDQGKELPKGELGEVVGYGGPGIMRCYYKQPGKTREAMWFDEKGRAYIKSGDIGKLDEEGFLYILDRKKDMIISGGMNIYSNDIENIMRTHPEVMDVAVIGIPHKKWGETPLALVIPKPQASISADELKDWTNRQLAKHQRLSAVEFRDSLPRNVLGKVLKRVLREPYWKEEG